MKNNFLIIFILFIISALVFSYFDLLGSIQSYFSLSSMDTKPVPMLRELPRSKQIIVATVGTPGEVKTGHKPLIDYIATQLAPYGIVKGVATTTATASEMANRMRLNKVDIYIDTIFTSTIISKLTNSPIVAVPWEYGDEKYNSVIFTKATSTIKKVSDLQGKKIAFFEPYSTSAYFLPKSELLQDGYELNELKNVNDTLATSSINYYFTNNDLKLYNAVISGEADAGALSEGVLKRFAGKDINNVTILHKAPDVYRIVVTLNSELSPELRTAIEDVLLTMDQTTEGKKALMDFHRTTKFTKIIDNDPLMAPLESLTGFIEKEILQR